MVTKKEAPEVDPWDDEQPKNPVTVVKGSGGEWASITFKAGTGYNAPWLVLKPSSMEEAKEMVQHEDLSELLDSIARKNKEFERFFGGPAAAAKAPASPGGGGWSKPKASSSSERPDDTCPVHNCDLEFVDAFTNPRTQKTTSARMACPVPKCYKKTYWLNDDGTWTLKEQ